jgi:DNA invertase Pin-like site-specific DNA recombinase
MDRSFNGQYRVPKTGHQNMRYSWQNLLQKTSQNVRFINVCWFRICNMRIGYARVSTDDQTLDLQRDALQRAKCRQIYEEHASGKTAMRPELEACLKSLRKGDTLVVWRLDRLGRSLGDLINLTTDLRSRGVDLESLTERIETGSPAGKLIFHVFASLAEFERNLIRERTMAGLRAARARGRNGGRPRKLRTKDIQAIKALMNAGELPVQDIADRFGVSRSTLYRNAASSESPKMLKTHTGQGWPTSNSPLER